MYTCLAKEPIRKITKTYFPVTGGSTIDNGGHMNNARQWIHESPKKIENGELANSATQKHREAPDSKVEDAWTALGNNIHGAPKKSGEWRIGEQRYA